MSGRKAKQARKDRAVPVRRQRWLSERRLAYVAATAAIVVAVIGGVAIANKKSATPAQALAVVPGAISHASGSAPLASWH